MSITLTPQAAEHIRGFLAKQGHAPSMRLRVKTTGCSGYSYVVEAAEGAVAAEDDVFESNGVNVVVDKQSLAFLQGTEIDYSREGLNAGFKFLNPNVKGTCGCGESFTV
jgi:iron-sulfur cluster assembly protein